MAVDLLRLAFGPIYPAESTVGSADPQLMVFLQEEFDLARRRIELSVLPQQPSEVDQTPRLPHRPVKLFVNLQCFFACRTPPS